MKKDERKKHRHPAAIKIKLETMLPLFAFAPKRSIDRNCRSATTSKLPLETRRDTDSYPSSNNQLKSLRANNNVTWKSSERRVSSLKRRCSQSNEFFGEYEALAAVQVYPTLGHVLLGDSNFVLTLLPLWSEPVFHETLMQHEHIFLDSHLHLRRSNRVDSFISKRCGASNPLLELKLQDNNNNRTVEVATDHRISPETKCLDDSKALFEAACSSNRTVRLSGSPLDLPIEWKNICPDDTAAQLLLVMHEANYKPPHFKAMLSTARLQFSGYYNDDLPDICVSKGISNEDHSNLPQLTLAGILSSIRSIDALTGGSMQAKCPAEYILPEFDFESHSRDHDRCRGPVVLYDTVLSVLRTTLLGSPYSQSQSYRRVSARKSRFSSNGPSDAIREGTLDRLISIDSPWAFIPYRRSDRAADDTVSSSSAIKRVLSCSSSSHCTSYKPLPAKASLFSCEDDAAAPWRLLEEDGVSQLSGRALSPSYLSHSHSHSQRSIRQMVLASAACNAVEVVEEEKEKEENSEGQREEEPLTEHAMEEAEHAMTPPDSDSAKGTAASICNIVSIVKSTLSCIDNRREDSFQGNSNDPIRGVGGGGPYSSSSSPVVISPLPVIISRMPAIPMFHIPALTEKNVSEYPWAPSTQKGPSSSRPVHKEVAAASIQAAPTAAVVAVRSASLPLHVLVSAQFLEDHPRVVSRLSSEYRIQSVDVQLQEPVTAILDTVTAISVVSLEVVQQDDLFRRYIKQLSSVCFKFDRVYLLLIIEQHGARLSALSDRLVQIYMAVIKFPAAVSVVQCELPVDDHGKRSDVIAHAVMSICRQAHRNASRVFSITIGALNDYASSRYTSRPHLQSFHTASPEVTSHCEFLQRCPTINYYVAILLLRDSTIRALAATKHLSALVGRVSGVDLCNAQLEQRLQSFLSLLRTHAGLKLLA